MEVALSLCTYFISGVLSEIWLQVEILAMYTHKNTKSLVSMFHTCPSTAWSACGGRRDLLAVLIRSDGLVLKALMTLRVQVPFYGLTYSPCSLSAYFFHPSLTQQHPPSFSSSNIPALFLPQDLSTCNFPFPFACNTQIFTWLASCRSDLCPRSLFQRSLP